MNPIRFFLAGRCPALDHAKTALLRQGCQVADVPDKNVTHLLLPVPSFTSDGELKGGSQLTSILEMLPKSAAVFGGKLLPDQLEGHPWADFLQDPLYLAENAAITAYCAVKLAMNRLPTTLQSCPVLILGWGRIGKCLGALLKAMGATVTIAARKEADRAMIQALGCEAADPKGLNESLGAYRVIFNTAPAPVLSPEALKSCRTDCLKIDLASQLGLCTDGVLWARGLPAKEAPEASGNLIAKTALRLAGIGRN